MNLSQLIITFRAHERFLGPFLTPAEFGALKLTCWALFRAIHIRAAEFQRSCAAQGYFRLLLALPPARISGPEFCTACFGFEFEAQKTLISGINPKKLKELFATTGHIVGLEWINAQKGSSDYLRAAIVAGQLDVLKWAARHQQFRATFTENTAAVHGHFNIIKWLNDCNKLSKETHFAWWAAVNDHAEIVIWAAENGCLIDDDTIAAAMSSSNIKLVKWVIDKKYKLPENVYFRAICLSKWNSVKNLHSLGFKMTKQSYNVIITAPPEIVEWARANIWPEI